MSETQGEPSGPDLTLGVAADSLADGQMLAGHVGDDAVLVARHGSEYFAIGATCTHYGGPLAEGVIAGDTVRCPWHHACFSLRTGEALRAPGIDPVSRYRVETVGDRIFVREAVPMAAKPSTGDKQRFLIVGGGAAGFAAAERLRRESFAGEVTILSADAELPVDRPNLSKDILARKAPEDWAYIKPRDFYDERNIALVLGREVTAIDVAGKTVRLADGSGRPFDKLLLATGAEPRRLTIPGGDRDHVMTLRSFADCRAIVAKALTAKTAVVIGASFIGLEVAASLVERGVKVQVVAREALPLHKKLGRELGEFVRAEHESHGVVFHLSRHPVAIEDGDVRLDDGARLAADLVVAGVGV